MCSLCLLPAESRGTPGSRRGGGSSSERDGFTPSLPSAQGALLWSPSAWPLTPDFCLWTAGLGFSLGALTISGERARIRSAPRVVTDMGLIFEASV